MEFYGKKAEEENMGDEEIQKYLDTLGDWQNKLKTCTQGFVERITLLSTLIILVPYHSQKQGGATRRCSFKYTKINAQP